MRGELGISGILCLAVAACSAGDTGSSGGRGPSGSSTGVTVGGGGSGASGANSFGAQASVVTDYTQGITDGGLADGGCVPGMFCASTNPDPNSCGTLTLEADVKVTSTPGNLLVIFDQSGSMNEQWSNGQSKLTAANDALVRALTPLQDLLTVGAIFFPTLACVPALPPPPGGAVQAIDGTSQIAFQPGPQFLTALQSHWANRGVGDNIGTPMQEAFDRADVAIQSATLTGPLVVVAFTDGQPNCFPCDDGLCVDPTMLTTAGLSATMTEPMHAAQWLSSKMIKTYMVGLPGAAGVQILNDVAVSGGTMQYIVPDDPTQLEMKLREVVQETIMSGFDSCSITLTPAANPPEKLMMIVEEAGMRQNVPHEAGTNTGWTISADGTQVEIFGQLCDDAKGGRFNSITFEYGCPEVPPPPPLPPLL